MESIDSPLTFEGVLTYSVAEPAEAVHFFEHTLGLVPAALEPGADDGTLRLYQLSAGLTLAVDISGASAGEPPCLLFSAPDLTAAAEHFLQRGCSVRELPWAVGSGFLARAPEGHSVCVVATAALEDDA